MFIGENPYYCYLWFSRPQQHISNHLSDSSVFHGAEVINLFEFLHIVCVYISCRPSVFPALLYLFICFRHNRTRLIQSIFVPSVHMGMTWIMFLVVVWCHEYNGTDGLSIKASYLELWWVLSRFSRPFRDTRKISNRGIKETKQWNWFPFPLASVFWKGRD